MKKTFLIIGVLIIGYIIGYYTHSPTNIIYKPIKIGFFVPLMVVTVIYTIVLDVVNLALMVTMPHVLFLLTNFCLLFIYCLISTPMYIMGRK